MADQGLTNRQIAEQLFLSAHAVGYHLHKVHAKLGIGSRAAEYRCVTPEQGVTPCSIGDWVASAIRARS